MGMASWVAYFVKVSVPLHLGLITGLLMMWLLASPRTRDPIVLLS